ncbi:uncharacterized protein LOC119297414 [Triticum dicoccoides]|uniref:uncharacterized protein LOC119297414 n=1 Tax=Triticum dicoccoides TaxID=85692 RepID=UPI00188E4898|nr:uncharacterized protein LOC119297414 [Triticum dicoccoides]
METAQERELLQRLPLQLQGWPFHAMPPSFDAGSGGSGSSSMSSDSFLLGWEPPFGGCFGLADAQLHDLFPLCMMEPLPLSPAATSTAAGLPSEQQGPAPAAMPNGELGDLLLNFWDAGDVSERPVAINSGCVAPQQHEKSSQSSAATATNSFLYDEDDLLGSIFSKRPTMAEEPPVLLLAPAEAEPLLSTSSSSSCHAGPLASGAGGARPQDATATAEPSGARAPPLPRCSSSSLKRATPEAAAESASAEAECSQSGGKRRRAASGSVLCPFAVLKPDGLDGGATLADINARILMRPARPVRHPVGEYACAPRVLAADAPGISGRAVSGFTRLHTPGRGTITIMRTRG